jgi:putative DNA primase/helicase
MSRPIRAGQPMLDALCARLWPPKQPTPRVVRRHRLPASDAMLLIRARDAKNGALFNRLWNGEWQKLYQSASEADLALCSLLAWWCDGDADRVDRLFRQSGLYREKWERSDYREWTIARACTGGHA